MASLIPNQGSDHMASSDQARPSIGSKSKDSAPSREASPEKADRSEIKTRRVIKVPVISESSNRSSGQGKRIGSKPKKSEKTTQKSITKMFRN